VVDCWFSRPPRFGQADGVLQYVLDRRQPQWIHAFFASLGRKSPDSQEDLLEAFDKVAKAAPTVSANVKLDDAGYNRAYIVRTLEEGEAKEEAADTEEATDTEVASSDDSECADLVAFAGAWQYELDGANDVDGIKKAIKSDGDKIDFEAMDDDDKAIVEKYDLNQFVKNLPEKEEEAKPELDDDFKEWAEQWKYKATKNMGNSDLVELIEADKEKFRYSDLDDDDKGMIEKYELTKCVDGWPTKGKSKGK